MNTLIKLVGLILLNRMPNIPFISKSAGPSEGAQKDERVLLEVKTSRSGEETPESMVQFLSSLTNLKKLVLPFWGLGVPISLEISVINQSVHFFVSVPIVYQSFIESQLIAVYPKALIAKPRFRQKTNYHKTKTYNA